MSARDELLAGALSQFRSREGIENLIDAYAHELAESLRGTYPPVRLEEQWSPVAHYLDGWTEAADMIDPKGW